jgi:predicted methyltransferase
MRDGGDDACGSNGGGGDACGRSGSDVFVEVMARCGVVMVWMGGGRLFWTRIWCRNVLRTGAFKRVVGAN